MTDNPEILKEDEDEDKFYNLRLIETEALRKCLDAIEALQEAEQQTQEGIAADHIENAVNQIILAMRLMGA